MERKPHYELDGEEWAAFWADVQERARHIALEHRVSMDFIVMCIVQAYDAIQPVADCETDPYFRDHVERELRNEVIRRCGRIRRVRMATQDLRD